MATLTAAQRVQLQQAAATVPADLHETFMHDVQVRLKGYLRLSDKVVDDIIRIAVERLSETRRHVMFCDSTDRELETAARKMSDGVAAVLAMARKVGQPRHLVRDQAGRIVGNEIVKNKRAFRDAASVPTNNRTTKKEGRHMTQQRRRHDDDDEIFDANGVLKDGKSFGYQSR